MIAQTLMANFALPALPPPATSRAGFNASSAPFVSEPRATSLACSPCAGRGGADNPAAARIAFLLPGRSAPFLWRLRKIVSVGRVKWFADSPYSGKDNCAWHLFDARGTGPAEFFGRAA